MKQYPTIPKKPAGNCTSFWVFDKLDGSNIRAEWSVKRGFFKFGTRKRLLGSDQGVLAVAQGLADKEEKQFRSIFSHNKIEKAVCFFEFWGPKSFAGSHVANDSHRLTLIDVDVYKQGMMSPSGFLDLFHSSSIDIPAFLHHGPIDDNFRNLVKTSRLPGMTYEGVVCKAWSKRKRTVEMFKIKSDAWISAVKAKYRDNPQLLEEVL